MRKFLFVLVLLITPFAFVNSSDKPKNVFSEITTANKFKTDFVVPEQTVLGADSPIPLGELVDLSISPIKEKPKYYESSSYAWKVLDNGKEKRVRPYPDNTGVFFGAGIVNKKLTVIVAVTHLYVVRDGDKVLEIGTRTNLIMKELVIGDDVPPPPPPPPDVTFPDGKFKLSKKSYDWAYQHVKLPAADRQKSAIALSGSFNSISSAIAAGTLRNTQAILDECRKSNNDALGQYTTAWDEWGKQLQDYIYQLYTDGALRTPEDFKIAFTEIKLGLEKVK